jgi:hypothetical protein
MEITITLKESEAYEFMKWRGQSPANDGINAIMKRKTDEWREKENVLENIPNTATPVVHNLAPALAGQCDNRPCDVGSDSYDIDGGLEDAACADLTDPNNWIGGKLQVGPSFSSLDNKYIGPAIPSPDGMNKQSSDGSVQTYIGPVAGIERDRRGLPWDARIHASSKAKVADGTWRMRRNVSDSDIIQVEKELRAKWDLPPLPVDEREVIISQDDNCLPPTPAGPPAPPVEVLPPTPPVNPDDVKNLIMEATRRGLSPESVSDACNKVGIPGLPGLINRPEMARPVAMILGVTI